MASPGELWSGAGIAFVQTEFASSSSAIIELVTVRSYRFI